MAGPWEKYQAQSGPWSKYQVDPNAAIKAQQAAKYPIAAETGVTDNRTAGQVAKDQAWSALTGPFKMAYSAIASVPSMVSTGVGVLQDMVNPQVGFRGESSRRGQEMMSDAAAGTVQLATTPARGAAALIVPESVEAPTPHEWQQHAEMSGANLAGLTLPKIPRATRATLNTVTTPERLMAGAAASRANAMTPTPNPTVPMSARGAVAQGVSRAMNPARNFKAGVQERVARWMTADQPGVNAAPTILEPEPGTLPQVDSSRTASGMRAAADDELARSAQWSKANEIMNAQSEPVGIERPTTPQFVDDWLRTAREQAEFDNTPALTTRQSSGPSQPLDVNFTVDPSAVPVDIAVKSLERAIRPLGRRSQASTLRNAETLLKVAPELATATYESFPSRAAKSLEWATRKLETVENAIPRSTAIPKQPILEKWAALAEDYKARGIPSAEAAIERIAKSWAALPDSIPWEQFLSKKRGFFEEWNANSGPELKAYRALQDATSEISTEMSMANFQYSVIRRALQDAGVDVRTGRRIREVGRK